MTTERSGVSLEMAIVEAIIDNLCGRYGFDTAFDVDDDILKAIKQEMADTIEDRLARAVSPTGICLPVLIHGKAYDVPIGVQLHIVALEEKLAALSSFAARHAAVPDGHNGMQACALLVRAVISDDAYAISFQSIGQYRAALISKIDGFLTELADKKAMLAQRDGG